MNLTKNLALALAFAICFTVSSSIAQDGQAELEIVDQDGQKVDVRKIRFKGQQDEDAEGRKGTIIIIDENGEQRELDVSGAQSIIVNKSVSSVVEDGNEEKKVSGKAIIIGPDGQKQEYELGGDLLGEGGVAQFQFVPDGQFWGKPGKLRIHRFGGESKFAIGVHCREVSDTLRAHVDLEEGIGLVVTNAPVADSPASKAGIQKHDILTYADQTQLAKTSDLSAAVQAAGSEKRAVSITLLRKGKEIGMDVNPVERKSLGPEAGAGRMLFRPGFDFDVQLEEFGPGLIIDDNLMLDKEIVIEDLMKKMEDLDIQFQQRMDDFKILRDELNNALKNQDEDDNE